MIAGAGFAMMAMRLAWLRSFGQVRFEAPVERVHTGSYYKASTEFYRITDNAMIGFMAGQVARQYGMNVDNYTVKL